MAPEVAGEERGAAGMWRSVGERVCHGLELLRPRHLAVSLGTRQHSCQPQVPPRALQQLACLGL